MGLCHWTILLALPTLGWAGDELAFTRDPTKAENCLHGTWTRGHSPHCDCSPLYYGDRCEKPVCLHGRLGNGSGECVCSGGFRGPNCDVHSSADPQDACDHVYTFEISK